MNAAQIGLAYLEKKLLDAESDLNDISESMKPWPRSAYWGGVYRYQLMHIQDIKYGIEIQRKYFGSEIAEREK